MLRWLRDAFCMLKYCLSSLLMRCEPPNYCRWMKAKNRNSVLCTRARAFSPVSPPLLLASAWVSNAVGAMGGKLPDKSKKCPRPESFAPSFSVGTALCERVQGRLGDCAALFLRWARRALLPLPERLRSSGGARFVAERNCRCKSHSRDGLRFFCPFSPFRGRRSLFLRPLFLKSGQSEGLFREK